ncbi:hypothetical protein GE21DRAFT_1120682, partial [Neurospora crassa]
LPSGHASQPRCHSSTAHRQQGRQTEATNGCNRTRQTTRAESRSGQPLQPSTHPYLHQPPTTGTPPSSPLLLLLQRQLFFLPAFQPQLPPHFSHHHHITLLSSSAKIILNANGDRLRQSSNPVID